MSLLATLVTSTSEFIETHFWLLFIIAISILGLLAFWGAVISFKLVTGNKIDEDEEAEALYEERYMGRLAK